MSTDAAQAHERGLDPTRRKIDGVFYTPAPIVARLVDDALGRVIGAAAPGATIRVVDPACGAGAFLIAAARALLARQEEMSPGTCSPGARLELLRASIFGVDVDPAAVELTRAAMAGLAGDAVPEDMSENIKVGNALLGADAPAAAGRPFVWAREFPAALAAGGFQAVLGNPPFVDAEAMTRHHAALRRHCAGRFEAARGNWDLFCVFIELGLQLCAPGGCCAMIVPNKLASADYAAATRRLLTQKARLVALYDLSAAPVFAAEVYPLAFVAQRGEVPTAAGEMSAPVTVTRLEDEAAPRAGATTPVATRTEGETSSPWAGATTPAVLRTKGETSAVTVLRTKGETSPWAGATTPAVLRTKGETSAPAGEAVAVLRMNAGGETAACGEMSFGTCLSQGPWPIFGRGDPSRAAHMRAVGRPLGELAEVWGAATVSEAYAIAGLIAEGDAGLRVVNSGTIDRCRDLWGKAALRYLGRSFLRPVIAAPERLPPRRLQQARTPKVIVAGMTRQIEAIVDAHGEVLAGKSTTICWWPADLRLLVAILHSRAVDDYYQYVHGGDRLARGYLRIGPPQLRALPVPDPARCDPEVCAQIAARVDRWTAGDATVAPELDALVDALYGLAG